MKYSHNQFQDGSDEDNCITVIPDDSYRNYLVPPPLENKLEVSLSIKVMDIQDIIEVDKTYQVPFTLYLSWNDGRLNYVNLKKSAGMNLLSEDEKSYIWKPILTFENTNEKRTTIVDLNTDIYIEKLGDFTLTKISDPENAKHYHGKDNSIIMQRYYREKFTCE